MIHRSLRLVRRFATVLSLGVSLGLVVLPSAQAAQKQDSKRPVAAKVVKASKKDNKHLAQRKRTTQVVAAKRTKQQLAAKRTAQVAAAKRKKTTLQVRSKSPRISAASMAPVARTSMVDVTKPGQRVNYSEAFANPAPIADAPRLSSNSVLVLDQNTQEVLFSKNEKAVLPIASLTKLMTGLLIVDAQLPMDEEITITQDDVDTLKGSSSRLAVGTRLSRGEALHLALMSSENRAAHALGRTYPGGLPVFVSLMNRRAAELGMRDTRYVEPTGLSSQNQSSAQDLARLVATAHQRPLLRQLSTSPSYEVVSTHNRVLQYRNSNRLIEKDDWNIGLQKTGYISEAGRCLVMQASVAGRQLIMVFLDAADKAARIGDAERVRHWVERTFQSSSVHMAQRPRV